MMSSVVQELTSSNHHPVDSDEQNLLHQVVNKAQEADLRVDRNDIVNLYVALKSKPMALLVGPSGSGKSVIVRCFAEALTGGNPLQCQLMAGHAWWAEQTGNVGLFATGQARFNDQKLLLLIEEALQPENRDLAYFACLAWISPAELTNIFTDLSSQLQTRIHRLSTIWLQHGLSFPPNLLLLGTMDTTTELEADSDLYAHTTVVSWTANSSQRPSQNAMFPAYGWNHTVNQGKTFLAAAVRDELLAWNKLATVVGWKRIDFTIWHAVKTLFRKHGYSMPDDVQTETILYLANAWDRQGSGLFSEHSATNSSIALDFALAQILFPRVKRELRESPELLAELARWADERLPCSSLWLSAQGHISLLDKHECAENIKRV